MNAKKVRIFMLLFYRWTIAQNKEGLLRSSNLNQAALSVVTKDIRFLGFSKTASRELDVKCISLAGAKILLFTGYGNRSFTLFRH
jgi:hypothetical protein